MANKPKRPDITKEIFLEKLVECEGVCYTAYKKLGLPYSTYRKWRREDPEFEAAIADIQSRTTDFVVSKMMDGIKKGNEKLIQFYLRTKGGFTEKRVVELQGDTTVNVTEAIESIKADLNE